MANIHLIATGGTIASRADPRTGASVPVDSVDALIDGAPALAELADVTVEELALVSSWDVTPDLMASIARTIGDRAAAAHPPAGFVVTHGTDTMEETAFALHGTLDIPQPVVLTGAMRSADAPDADGPANLLAAARVAVDPSTRGLGTVVVMAGEVHAARWVTKTHTTATDTFTSPGRDPIGRVVDDHVELTDARPDASLPPLPVPETVPDVPLVTMVAGLSEAPLLAVERSGATGLVVAGSGAGNIRGALRPALERLLDAGVVVVLASRCHGPVTPTYGGDGGGATLVDLGLIPAGDLSPYKARLALAFLLGDGADADRISDWFARAHRSYGGR